MESYFQLLCTFSTLEGYQRDISEIERSYVAQKGNLIFILQNSASPEEIFLTYNVQKNNHARYQKTISVHRKKDFNVIYSINALNKLVSLEENENRRVDWVRYKNSLIVICDGELKIIPTKLLLIHRVK